MSVISDQVRQAWSGAINGLLLRLIQSPGTTIGGAMASLGGVGLTLADDYPHVLKASKICLAVGMALVGLNATSHGFVNKQSGNTQTFTKPDGRLNLDTVAPIPPVPPPVNPPKP